MPKTRIGVVMDPVSEISPAKDSTLAMMLEAGTRGWEIHYFEQSDLRLRNGLALGDSRVLQVQDDPDHWFDLGEPEEIELGKLDVILMRKDPPFDTEYIYTTYILERAQQQGALVVNHPAALRDMNEKVFTAWFPQCCPETLITRSMDDMRGFLAQEGKIVVKPLHSMGGRSIFVVAAGDNNANVVFETLTHEGSQYAIAQTYIPEIRDGDKRVILVDGQAVDAALARVPPENDNRGNLVMGALPEVRQLSDRDRWICEQVGPVLRDRGVIFAGLDIIGDFLTEINVTSPTGIRELKKLADLDVAAQLMDCVAAKLAAARS